MIPSHRQPTVAHTPDLELSPYPNSDPYPSSSTHPLLGPSSSSAHVSRPPDNGDDHFDAGSIPSSRKRRRTSGVTHALRRYWKPLVLISSPFVLLFLYGLIHPHVPGLPPLPKVKVQLGDSTADTDVIHEVLPLDDCVCGQTDEGDRLCKVYRKEGLRTSRLVRGTGSRVRRVLQKAREGEKLKIGVLGGSGE